MALVLPSVAAVLTGRSPIVGEPSEAEAASRVLARMREEIDECAYQSSRSLVVLNGLTSVSVLKVRQGIAEQVMPGARRLSADLSKGSAAFGRYAHEIEHIHAAARDTIREVEQYLHHIRGCAGELEQAAHVLGVRASRVVPSSWDQVPSVTPPHSGEVGELTRAEMVARMSALHTWGTQAGSWGWAVDRVHECQTRWGRLKSERREAEQALVSALHGTNLGGLLTSGGSPGRAAVTRAYTGGAVHPTRWQSDAGLWAVLDATLTPAEAAQAWERLGLSDEEVAGLPMQVLFALANAEGIPFRVQDIAAQKALGYALEHPDEAFQMLGFTHADMSVAQFTVQLGAVKDAYDEAGKIAGKLPGQPCVQLFGFGAHDGVLTAAVSLGDVDTATNVALNVAGMGSNAGDMQPAIKGGAELFGETARYDPSVVPAVVTWIGYHSPAMVPSDEVLDGGRAASGAVELARFIDGVNAVRDTSGTPMREFAVFAHSYGSTTAAEALKLTETEVDVFVTYGSAGLIEGTEAGQLHADRVYATQATGDGVAGPGRLGSGRLDPVDLEGVTEFSAEKTVEGKEVTVHDMFAVDESPSLMNPDGRFGYLSPGTSSVRGMGKILAGEAP